MTSPKKNDSFRNFFYLLIDSYLLNIVYLRGNVSLQRAFVFTAMIVYVFYNAKIIKKTLKIIGIQDIAKFVIPYFYLLVLGLLVPIFQRTFDFTYITMYVFCVLGWILKILVLVIHNEKISNGEMRADSFMMMFIKAMLLYVFVSVLMMLIPSIRVFILDSIFSTDLQMQLLSTSAYYTRIGWSGISVYGHSLRCSLASFFSLLLYLKKSCERENNTIKFLFYFLACSMGCFFYARTGLIVNLVMLMFSLLVLVRLDRKGFRQVCVVVLVLISVLLVLLLQSSGNEVLSWAMSIFIDVKEGRVGTSINNLLGVLFTRISPEELIIGSGRYSSINGSHYMNTDSGFMRNVLFMGLLFSIFIYVYLIKIFIKFTDKQMGKFHFFSFISLLFMFIIFEIKGEAYQFFLPFFYVLWLLIKGKQNNEVINEN